MIVNSKLLEGGLTPITISKLIQRHTFECQNYVKCRSYYNGDQAMLNHTPTSNGVSNNKIVVNHARYIVKITKGFIVGEPVGYIASEGFDITKILENYNEQDIADVDSEIVGDMCITGKALEMVYTDENSEPRSAKLAPETAFVVRDDTVNHDITHGILYYPNVDIDGNVKSVTVKVCDRFNWYTYIAQGASYEGLKLIDTTPHRFGDVPMIEYKNSDNGHGDIEDVMSLIDAYNLLQSERLNDKEDFVNAFLFLRGIDLDSENAQKLKKEKILIAPDIPDATAQYLQKTFDENQLETLKEAYRKDIHKIAMVPDLSDESFGGNLSGVAIKYKIIGFLQMVKDKERYIKSGLKRRFKLYNNLYMLMGMKEVPTYNVDIIFKHNLPANDVETAQMIATLKGIVSDETLLAQLSYVTDPAEEANDALKQSIESSTAKLKAQNDAMVGYNRPVSEPDELNYYGNND